MKLMVASWNSGGADWNAEAEETELRTYTINHSFNGPAECIITLADPTGVLLRKYNAEANDVYLGSGKITLEDPTGTDIFYGRIISADGTTEEPRTLILTCRDWMDQLDEEIITYDMREDLDGAGLRQSEAHADLLDTVPDYLFNAGIRTLFSAQADDGGAFTDETAAANELTEDDMTLLPAAIVANDAYYFGFETKVSGFTLYISQQGDWVGSVIWEYYDGAAWSSLADFQPSDAASQQFEVAGQVDYSWTVPGDWAKVAVNGITEYWVRCRVNVGGAVTTQPLGRDAYAEYYFYDDDMAWDTTPGNAQNFDGMNLILTTGMAGEKTWTFHPYHATAAGEDNYLDAREHVWVDNDDLDGGIANNDWTLTYDFHVELGHNTPSDFYVHDSISAASVIARWKISSVGSTNHSHLQIDDKTDGVIELEQFDESVNYMLTVHTLNATEYAKIVDANGIASVIFDVDRVGGNAELSITYLAIEVTVKTTGYSSVIAITETETNRLRVSTDLVATATRIWEKIPYCIAKPIYKHIDTAETVALSLISDEAGDKSGSGPDPVIGLTAAGTIEHTAGISTRQYKNRTRLQIIQDLAMQDNALFWITLGGTTVTYKQTFGADTMQLTDATVDSWQSKQDYLTVINSVDVYGGTSGNYEVYQQSQNAASIAKFLATRTKVMKNQGLVADADAASIGTTIAARDSDVQQMVACTISGNTATAAHDTTIKLGEIVEITSSYLWSTAAKDYVVVRWAYDSVLNKTFLTLHPKSSVGYQPIRTLISEAEAMRQATRQTQEDSYVPDPITHEVS